MTIFAADTFAGTAASDLGGQSASDGGSWTARDGTGAISGNGAGGVGSASSGGRFGYYHSGSPPSADYAVSAVISVTSAGKSSIAVAARMNTGATEQYFAAWDGGGGVWYIAKRVGGTDTTPWTGAAGTVPTTPVTAKLEVSGTDISLYLNGSLAQTISDSSISAAGKAGIYNAFADVAGCTVDDFSAETLLSAPVIDVQPTNQTATDGATASFTTTVSDATSYQWETLAPLGGSWGNVSGGSGATSDDYTTGTLSRSSDSGRFYRLKATNSEGDTYSNVVQLQVTNIPTSYDYGGFVIGSG